MCCEQVWRTRVSLIGARSDMRCDMRERSSNRGCVNAAAMPPAPHVYHSSDPPVPRTFAMLARPVLPAERPGRFRCPPRNTFEEFVKAPKDSLALLLNSDTVLILDAVNAFLLDVDWQPLIDANRVRCPVSMSVSAVRGVLARRTGRTAILVRTRTASCERSRTVAATATHERSGVDTTGGDCAESQAPVQAVAQRQGK